MIDDSEFIDLDSIFMEYEFKYNENLDRTNVKATVRLGGLTHRKIELSDPAHITFDDEKMIFNHFTRSYTKSFDGFVSNAAFEYTDIEENTFIHNIGTVEEIGFPDALVLNDDKELEFEWVGNPLKENETIILSLRTSPMHHQIHSISDIGETMLLVGEDEMDKINHESVFCELTRVLYFSFDEDDTFNNGNMSISYIVSKRMDLE